MRHLVAQLRPIRPWTLVPLAVLILGACGDEGADAALDTSPGAAPESATLASAEQLVRGEAVYQSVCSTCHALQPPPELAPPFTHVARHIREATESREAFVAHVVEYVANPGAERSLLPTRAVERFGLMPAQVVSAGQLEDVAAYLWTLADSAQGGMDHEGEEGMGEEGMGGEGMGEGGMGGMNHGPGNGMGGNGMGGGGTNGGGMNGNGMGGGGMNGGGINGNGMGGDRMGGRTGG